MHPLFMTILPWLHGVQAHYLAGGAPSGGGASTNPNLGNPQVGAPLPGASGIGTAVNGITGTVSSIIGPMSLLGMIWGGLVHTQVFHTPQSKETGKEILRYSAFGLIIAVLAPLGLSVLSHI